MKSSFAKGTSVDVGKSKIEIERMLQRYGVTGFHSGWDGERAAILFEKDGRRIRFTLNLPVEVDFERAEKNKRNPAKIKAACAAESRRLWRALALVIKAKLESVASGIETFENAFLSNIVVPGAHGETFGEWAAPRIKAAYDNGTSMPPMLGM